MTAQPLRSKTVLTLLGAGLCLAMAATPARGAVYWQGADGASWHVGSNWDTGSSPVSTDSAYIANGHRATITSAANVSRLYIGIDNTTGAGGGIIQNSGTATLSSLWVGVWYTNPGTYVLNDLNGDSALTISGNLVVGESNATSTFVQNGGAVSAARFYLGNAGSATAHYELHDGSVRITGGNFEVADFGGTNVTSLFSQTGGTVTSSATVTMGSAAGTTGSAVYDLLGGTLLISNATPFTFNSTLDSVYFNFRYGSPDDAALLLKGTWDFASLTSIAKADFRVHGEAATAGQLVFMAGTGSLAGYTIIYAVPEPSALLMAAMGLVGLAACGRRKAAARRRPRTIHPANQQRKETQE
jgi:hypothetical protein